MSKRTHLAGLQARARTAAERSPRARVVVSPSAADPAAVAEDGSPATTTAELWLYGTVGGYWWGFDSDDVADALRAMGDVDQITVRLHSFGGSAVEGIAIANLLANHSARIRIVVDGIAASAATQIALAGAELIMSPGSQFMVHDAWMYTGGNADQLRADADWIEKQSINYAETYAHRAGGTAEQWRTRMLADNGEGTWYTAAETVAEGLAARVDNIASTTTPPPMPEPEDLDDGDLAAAAAFDFEVLLDPAARAAWSRWSASASTRRVGAPKPPAASADGNTHNRETETAMEFTPEQLTQMRQELGLADTADAATIVAAMSEALAETAADVPAPPNPTASVPEGMTLIDTDTLASLQADGAAGREARTQQLTDHRDRTISAAIAAGKFAPARREHYEASWASDPIGTEQIIGALAAGLVPVSEIGHDLPPAESINAQTNVSDFAAGLGLTEEDLR